MRWTISRARGSDPPIDDDAERTADESEQLFRRGRELVVALNLERIEDRGRRGGGLDDAFERLADQVQARLTVEDSHTGHIITPEKSAVTKLGGYTDADG